MKPRITPHFYSDLEIFKKEQTTLFQSLWQFVCLVEDIANHNDYICTEVGGKSVIIQNFEGELKAFHNVCSHRFSLIRQPGQGNGPLKCPYHGWAYDSRGIPVGIPCRSEFDDLTNPVSQSFGLDKWLVETCGSLVFIKRYDDGITLKEFLKPEIFDELEKISKALGKKIGYYQSTIKANWKIVVENSLEDYHVRQIHPQTLGKFFIPESNYYFVSFHSVGTLMPAKQGKKQELLESVFSSRPYKVDKYHHYLVFPNMMIATTRGLSFSVQSVYPISPFETRFTSYLFLSRLDDTNNISLSKQNIIDTLSESIVKFNSAVLNEDKMVCELVQKGIVETEKTGILSYREKRIYEFQKAYESIISYYNKVKKAK